MNKKAQLSFILIIIVAIALVAMSFYVFVTFDDDLKTQSLAISEIISETEFNQQYVIAQSKLLAKQTITSCPSCTAPQFAPIFRTFALTTRDNYFHEGVGNFYTQINEYKHSFEKTNDTITLKIPNITLQSKQENNKITRTFNLCLEFNQKGEYLYSC